jgi:hypothetical protein
MEALYAPRRDGPVTPHSPHLRGVSTLCQFIKDYSARLNRARRRHALRFPIAHKRPHPLAVVRQIDSLTFLAHTFLVSTEPP